MTAADACPWPLYTSVLMRDAVRWRSSFDVRKLVLPNSVEAAIHQLLNELEKRLGVVFVSHTLAFITAVDHGLSEVSQWIRLSQSYFECGLSNKRLFQGSERQEQLKCNTEIGATKYVHF